MVDQKEDLTRKILQVCVSCPHAKWQLAYVILTVFVFAAIVSISWLVYPPWWAGLAIVSVGLIIALAVFWAIERLEQ